MKVCAEHPQTPQKQRILRVHQRFAGTLALSQCPRGTARLRTSSKLATLVYTGGTSLEAKTIMAKQVTGLPEHRT